MRQARDTPESNIIEGALREQKTRNVRLEPSLTVLDSAKELKSQAARAAMVGGPRPMPPEEQQRHAKTCKDMQRHAKTCKNMQKTCSSKAPQTFLTDTRLPWLMAQTSAGSAAAAAARTSKYSLEPGRVSKWPSGILEVYPITL